MAKIVQVSVSYKLKKSFVHSYGSVEAGLIRVMDLEKGDDVIDVTTTARKAIRGEVNKEVERALQLHDVPSSGGRKDR